MTTAHAQAPTLTPTHQFRCKLLRGDEPSFATTLVGLLCDHFQSLDWFEWEPDVLGQEVQDDFQVVMPQGVRDRIWAFVTALTTDRFFEDPVVLNHVANALSGEYTPMDSFEPAGLDELAWALVEVGMSAVDAGEALRFGDEVQAFLLATLKQEQLRSFGPFDFLPEPAAGEGLGFGADAMLGPADLRNRRQQQQDLEDWLNQRVQELRRQLQQAGLRLPGNRK